MIKMWLERWRERRLERLLDRLIAEDEAACAKHLARQAGRR